MDTYLYCLLTFPVFTLRKIIEPDLGKLFYFVNSERFVYLFLLMLLIVIMYIVYLIFFVNMR